MKKRSSSFQVLLTLCLFLVLLAMTVPSGLQYSVCAASEKTFYFSTSGGDFNDGTSPAKAISDITRVIDICNDTAYSDIPLNIKLKRGDAWYRGQLGWNFLAVRRTASAPVTISSYGDANLPAPIVSTMLSYTPKDFKSLGNDLYSRNVDWEVFRVYIQNLPLVRQPDRSQLQNNQYCFEGPANGGKIIIKLNHFEDVKIIETIQSSAGDEITFEDSSYITIKDLTIKGTAAWSPVIFRAPTNNITIQNCTLRQFRTYGFAFGASPRMINATNLNDKIIGCTVDKGWTEGMNKEYAHKVWNSVNSTGEGEGPGGDGVWIGDAVDSLLVKGNFFTNMGHSCFGGGVSDPKYPGIVNNVFEDNVGTKGFSSYCRGFAFGAYGDKCTNNIIRRNYFYDQTNSSHFFGNKNKCYSNIFDVTTMTTSGSRNRQPYAIDMMLWSVAKSPTDPDNIGIDNIIANNTIYDAYAGIKTNNALCKQNTIVNNLIVKWKKDEPDGRAAINVSAECSNQIIQYNGFWNQDNTEAVIVQGPNSDGQTLKVANGYDNGKTSGNFQLPPAFVGPVGDGKFKSDYFKLSASSPYKAAGKDISAMMGAGFTDFYGKKFDAKHPSIGAIQYQSEGKSAGTLSTVEPLKDITAIKGKTSYNQLNLPASVQATVDGKSTYLSVAWQKGNFNENATGKYTLKGVVGGMEGIQNPKGISASQVVLVNDGISIISVKKAYPRTENVGISFDDLKNNLPLEAGVNYDDNTSGSVPVIWQKGNLDLNKPGKITIIGQLQPPKGILNPLHLTMTVDVTLEGQTVPGGSTPAPNQDKDTGSSILPLIIGGAIAIAVATVVVILMQRKKKA